MKVKNKNCSKINLKLSKNCLQKIKEWDLLKKRVIESNVYTDWGIWRKAKNKVNNIIRNEKKKNDDDKIIKFENGKS